MEFILLQQMFNLLEILKKSGKNHVSIALDKELNRMYSFGRLNPYNTFYEGFVHEYINEGTFKRFYKTRAKIYSLEISDEQYEEISKNIIKFEQSKNKYKFLILLDYLQLEYIREYKKKIGLLASA